MLGLVPGARDFLAAGKYKHARETSTIAKLPNRDSGPLQSAANLIDFIHSCNNAKSY
jgi:hypothetical protein